MKKINPVNHRKPGFVQLVGEVYARPGMRTDELGDAMGIPYWTNLQHRVRRLIRQTRGLVVVKRDGKWHRYYPGTKLSPAEARKLAVSYAD